MKAFFYAIEDLFVNHLFWPLDQLRHMHGWWGPNFFNWILILIGFAAGFYWLNELKKYDENGKESRGEL